MTPEEFKDLKRGDKVIIPKEYTPTSQLPLPKGRGL